MAIFSRRKTSIDLSRKNPSERFFLAHVLSKSALIVFLCVALIVVVLLSYFFYSKYSALRDVVAAEPEKSMIDPSRSVIAMVDKHLLLPGGEQPIIAEVTDIGSLAQYAFFRNAMMGDVVLVYCNAKLSILYSSTRDKIIEIERTVLLGAACPEEGGQQP